MGRFPIGWGEWNGKYRDTMRRFWRGDPGQVGEFASRLAGSSDLFEASQRSPQASVNFVTCHDGFTLHDLVSYEQKHNEANGEDNRDGNDHNLSRNWGAEGPTDAVHVVRMRERMKRNFLATLAFSQGVPMLSHGDELGRTQLGNNNAYCQDNPLTWVDWRLTPARARAARVHPQGASPSAPPTRCSAAATSSAISRDEPGGARTSPGSAPTAREMTEADWRDPRNHVLGMLIRGRGDRRGGRARPAPARRGDPAAGERGRPLPAVHAAAAWSRRARWTEMVNTAHPMPRRCAQGG